MKAKDRYYMGVDPATPDSKGSIAVFNHNTQTFECMITLPWYKKFKWVNRLVYKYWVWKMYFKYFRRIKLIKESNKAENQVWFGDHKVKSHGGLIPWIRQQNENVL